MPKVVDGPNYHVYVYAESSSRHVPHCHVRWTDGTDLEVTLPSLSRIAGEKVLTRAEKELIAEHVDEIIAKWQELNPGR